VSEYDFSSNIRSNLVIGKVISEHLGKEVTVEIDLDWPRKFPEQSAVINSAQKEKITQVTKKL
jgi:hypothetical protein